MPEVILVDENDLPLGIMEKMEAHYSGSLHRAFSVFIFNTKGEMLIQQRADTKYHSGGLWTNACCSHPMPGEDLKQAAQRRLFEEMGFNTPLQKVFAFSYYAEFSNGLVENEFDHVFVGTFEGTVAPVVSEVRDYCYMSMLNIKESIASHPLKYTEWFKIAFPKVEEYIAATVIHE